jgi:hypothetical protein
MLEQPVRWRLGTRVAFRFLFSYLAIYCVLAFDGLESTIRFMLTGDFSDTALDLQLHKVVPWIGRHILHFSKDITIFSNGSGDTTYDWALVLCTLIVALASTLLWSVLDRRRSNYRRLHVWLRQAVVFVLATAMLMYGTDKFPPNQFGDLSLVRQMAPLGKLTPFRLLWSFMAASKGYTIFGGLSEILGGVLLLIPATVTLGSLVSAAVLANVVALNLFYDVPVKLFSVHLLLMALFLSAPDLPRLGRLLILNRPTEPASPAPLAEKPWVNRWTPVLVSIFAVCLGCVMTVWSWKEYSKRQKALAAPPPYYGAWVVDDLTASGTGGCPLFTDKLRTSLHLQPGEESWRKLIFEDPKEVTIQFRNDAADYFKLSFDLKNTRAELGHRADAAWKGQLTFEKPDAQRLVLGGTLNGCDIQGKLHRMTAAELQLANRGFHLINEHPF